MTTDIEKLVSELPEFAQRIKALKSANPPEDFSWYGYDILANIHHLHRLLGDDFPALFRNNASRPILDVGGADGDLSFYLESQGFKAEIIDYPSTNWNGLQGAYRLKSLLQSEVCIREVDLDSAFSLGAERYGLVLILGILYHLKNPFYVLEQLASCSRQIILSTRIFRSLPGHASIDFSDLPVSYLLDPVECNNDPTNYWIFTQHSLRRVLQRSGWKVEKLITLGDREASNPFDTDHDERAFVLASSSR